ncbi:hypothetical protein C2G38_2009519, partial [Gigaspora rosea]
MYIFGGQTEEGYSNELIAFDMEKYNSSNASWEFVTPKGPLPPARIAHISCAYEDKIYMFGGMDSDRCYNDMWCYDINNNTWSQLSCTGLIPYPRKYHGATIADGNIYIFGGIDHEGKELGDLTSFQISTQRWYMFQNMGPAPSPRYLHTMSAENEKIFVFGGESNQSPKPDEDGTIHVLDTSRIRYPNQEPLQSQQQMLSQQQMSSQIPQQQIPQQQSPQQQMSQQQMSQQQILQQQMSQQQILQQQMSQQQVHQQQQIMSQYSTPLTSPTQQQTFAQRNNSMSPRQEFSPYGFNSPTSDLRIMTQSPKSYQMSETMDPLDSPKYSLPNSRQGSIPRTQKDINRGPIPENWVYMERQRSNSPNSPQLRSNPNIENIRKQSSSPVTARQSPTNIDHQRNNSNSSPILVHKSKSSADNIHNYPVIRIRTQPSLENVREIQPNVNIRQPRIVEISGNNNNNNNTMIQRQGAPIYSGNPEFYQQNDFRNPRPLPRPPLGGYIEGFDPNLMSGNFQPGMFQNPIYQNYSKPTNSYIESAISSPTLPTDGHYRMSDTVDHSSANIMSTEYNEFMRELEQRDTVIQSLKKRETWLKAELAIARKTGYTIDQVEFEGDKSEKVDLDQLIDNADKGSEKFSLLFNIAKIKQELMKSKANIAVQAQVASQKIIDSERIRTAALQEAAYFKAKLTALKNHSKPDLVIIESERASELEKRLTKALNDKETVQAQLLHLQQDFNNEKSSKECAEERAKTAVERAEEAENAHARSLTELAALHSRATAAESELRETKGQLLNSNIELKKSQNNYEHAKVKIVQMESTIMKARSENSALQRQLAEASEEVIRIKGKLNEKERLLEEKSRILEETEVKLGMMR